VDGMTEGREEGMGGGDLRHCC